MSAISIVSALAILGGTTFALFDTQATLADNTLSTGNANLLIANDTVGDGSGSGTGYAASIPGVDFDNIAPGFITEKVFWLKNHSTSGTGLDVELGLENLGGAFHGTDGSLPDKMKVQFICDTDSNGLATGNSASINQSVNAWISGGPLAMSTIGPSQGGSNAVAKSDADELLCKMIVTLDPLAGNELQNSDISFDGIFNGTQDTP